MRCYECLHHDHCDMEFLPRTKTCFKPKSAQSSTLDAGCSLQPLFDHMKGVHGLTLTESELQDIIRVAQNETK